MTSDKQRDRLVELLQGKSIDTTADVEYVADYLLANGAFVSPCMVGQTVYYVSEKPINLQVLSNTVYEAEVVTILTTNLGTSLVIQIRNEYGCTEIPDVNDWGKTVFLSREEAEEALNNVQNGNSCEGGVQG